MIGGVSLEWILLHALSISVGLLTVNKANLLHIWTVCKIGFVSGLPLEFNIWPNILRWLYIDLRVDGCKHLLVILLIIAILIVGVAIKAVIVGQSLFLS